MPHKRAKKSVRDERGKSSGYNRAPSALDEMDDAPKSALRILNSMKVQAEYGKRKRGELAEDDGAGRKGKKGKQDGQAAGDKSEGEKRFEERMKKAKKADNNGLKIHENESLAHFNRRVEDSLRSSVVAASRKATAFTSDVARREKEERMAKHEALMKGKGKAKDGEEGMDDEDAEIDVEAAKAAKKEAARVKAEAALQKKREAVALDFAPKASSSAPKRLNDIVQAPPQLTLPRLSTKILGKKNGGGVEGVGSEHSAAVSRLGLSPAQARILEEERERVIKHYRELKMRKEFKASGGGSGGVED